MLEKISQCLHFRITLPYEIAKPHLAVVDLSDGAVTCLADYRIGRIDQVGVMVVAVCRKEKDIRCHPFFFYAKPSDHEVYRTELLVEPIGRWRAFE